MNHRPFPNLRSIGAAAFALGALTFVAPVSAQAQAPAGRFPAVSGRNLDGREYSFPTGFEGDVNFVFVTFRREQQPQVESWMQAARPILNVNPRVRHYELPLAGTVRRGFFSRPEPVAAARDAVSRGATIPLNVDRDSFAAAVGASSQDQMMTLLVDRSGKILYRKDGALGSNGAREMAFLVRRALHGEVYDPAATPAPKKANRPKPRYTPKPSVGDDPRLATDGDKL